MAAYLFSDCVGEQIGKIRPMFHFPIKRYLCKANKRHDVSFHTATRTRRLMTSSSTYLLVTKLSHNHFFSEFFPFWILTNSQMNDLEGVEFER
jgi:hypothetical protein